MESFLEVRWHGRAQQGVVTAAKLLGESCLMAGNFVQAFPEFGPERMGAPVRAYNRVSASPIKLHCQVTNPGFILIADPTLIGGSAGVTTGALKGALFIINTPKPPEEMRKELNLADKTAKVYTVDAATISLEAIGRFMPNTPLLGALARVSDIVDIEAVINNFKTNYAKKYGPKIIAGNVEAMKRGYDEVKGMEVS
ncbi:MAG: 2-oxoacid:acceptor oxidoreductase family protein [Thermodesulfobacteriota bacterium]